MSPAKTVDAGELVKHLLEGNRRALTRVMTLIENGYPEAREAMKGLFPHSGKTHIVGITGPAGSGKSTLTGALARELRKRDRTVGIVAVDPTSPFSQGALLGDRIRMQDLTSDPGVFIRSMATRGALGGLAAATSDVVTVLDAAGYDIVLVETVGAGQDEVEIASAAHTTIVVSIPGAGDDMQAIKAGILEIADILVVNKADLPGANSVWKQLHIFMELDRQEGWTVPILKATSSKDEGTVELLEEVDKHREWLRESGRLDEMLRQRARRQLLALTQALLLGHVLESVKDDGTVERLVESIASRKVDPHTAAEELIAAADQ